VLLGSIVLGVPLLLLWLAYAASERLAEAVPARFDAELARPLWAQLEASPERCRAGTAPEYLGQLVQPLVSAARSDFEYRFLVLKDPAVNAFALPGGYVVVNLGLLQAAQSSEEVAAVLAHEIAHVELRHGSKKLLRTLGISLVLSWLLGSPDPGVVVGALRELESRRHERGEEADADTQGLELLARAGISPGGMASFFERLAREPTLPELLSTHPDPGARASRAAQASGRTSAVLPAVPASWTCE
jgi:predicted Zn-dependent protease